MKLAAFSHASGVPLCRSVSEMTVSQYVAMAEWLSQTGSLPAEMNLFGKS